MTPPDVVYVVRPSDRNEELRYSLRSLANLPHGKVWIAGYMPSWLDGIGHIRSESKPGSHKQTKANIRAACENPEVSEQFVYMNDDFFVMQPMDALPVLHRGLLAEVIARDGMASAYVRAMEKDLAILTELGIAEPLMYDLHAPMLVSKAGMLKALDLCDHHKDARVGYRLHERTLYGNLQHIGGERSHNHKVHRTDKGWQSWPFVSTNDSSFKSHQVGEHIRSRFTEAAPYETAPPPPQRVRPIRVVRRPIRHRAGESVIRRIVRGAA